MIGLTDRVPKREGSQLTMVLLVPMAKWISISSPIAKPQFFFIFALLSLVSVSRNQLRAENEEYVRTLDPELYGLKKEKLSHFRVYWHDIYSGTHPTVAAIVQPPSNASSTLFGSLSMMDDPLTEGPQLSSKLVGRAQGLYGSSGQEEAALIMAMNFVFLEGEYNGSTITILGRNDVFSKHREMPLIGGSGLFRFARGYAEARTYSFDQKTGDAVVEYNLYVFHY